LVGAHAVGAAMQTSSSGAASPDGPWIPSAGYLAFSNGSNPAGKTDATPVASLHFDNMISWEEPTSQQPARPTPHHATVAGCGDTIDQESVFYSSPMHSDTHSYCTFVGSNRSEASSPDHAATENTTAASREAPCSFYAGPVHVVPVSASSVSSDWDDASVASSVAEAFYVTTSAPQLFAVAADGVCESAEVYGWEVGQSGGQQQGSYAQFTSNQADGNQAATWQVSQPEDHQHGPRYRAASLCAASGGRSLPNKNNPLAAQPQPSVRPVPTAEMSKSARTFALSVGFDFFDALDLDDLSSCCFDAHALARTLRDAGVVHCHEDLELLNFKAAADTFCEQLAVQAASGSLEVAFVFLASHGFQLDSEIFLAAKDTVMASPEIATNAQAVRAHLQTHCIDVTRLILQIRQSWSGPLVVVVDACRTAPVRDMMLSPVAAAHKGHFPDNTLMCYSTAAGLRSLDGSQAVHSPFMAALLSSLANPQLSIRSAIESACNAVDETQQPTCITVKFKDCCLHVNSAEVLYVRSDQSDASLAVIIRQIQNLLHGVTISRAMAVAVADGGPCPSALEDLCRAHSIKILDGSHALAPTVAAFWTS
jgi:hypothetical protein